jgi:beta-glucanase (GH16 family)
MNIILRMRVPFFLALCLLVGGCRSKPLPALTPTPTFTPMPTSTPQPVSTPTPIPTRTATVTVSPSLAPLDSTWKLAWSDEFDGPAIDPANWGYEVGYIRNQEYQFYTTRPENAYISNGNLVIMARREKYNGYAYTSASLNTQGLHEFQYGRFEMRARIPTDSGAWPAWWALGVNILTDGWPKSGEIDMMEFYRGKLLFNIMDSVGNWDSVTRPFTDSASYHVWTMDWDADGIRLYFDGTLVNDYTISLAAAGSDNPFRQKLYLLVNLAIGGTNGGDPSGSTFPQYYYIDYIRVYQK